MKTLFLDYDGVLHPGEVYLVRGKGVVLRNEGHTLFEYADALADALEAHKDVQIVLSTSWVAMLDFKRAKKRLPTRLQDRIKGATWHSSFDRGYWQQLTRFQQIYQYANRHNLSDWLALDDDDEGWPDVCFECGRCGQLFLRRQSGDCCRDLRQQYPHSFILVAGDLDSHGKGGLICPRCCSCCDAEQWNGAACIQ